ncbi:MAG: hypothetical protein AAGE52_07745 [Myxococcota bacterium]
MLRFFVLSLALTASSVRAQPVVGAQASLEARLESKPLRLAGPRAAIAFGTVYAPLLPAGIALLATSSEDRGATIYMAAVGAAATFFLGWYAHRLAQRRRARLALLDQLRPASLARRRDVRLSPMRVLTIIGAGLLAAGISAFSAYLAVEPRDASSAYALGAPAAFMGVVGSLLTGFGGRRLRERHELRRRLGVDPL